MGGTSANRPQGAFAARRRKRAAARLLPAHSSPEVHPRAQHALGRLFDKVEGGKRHGDEDGIAEPGVEADESQAIEHMGVVDQGPKVEVEQVEAIAGLADKNQGRHPKACESGLWPARHSTMQPKKGISRPSCSMA